jgi:D-3-phosphoglycerate dehydrogenase
VGFKVVLTLRYPGLPQDEEAYRRLDARFFKVDCSTEEDILAAAHDADVVITTMQPFTRRVIQGLSRCRLISVIGIGYEGVDVAAATARGILVSHVPDYCLEEVSDHTMALLLACARKLLPLVQAVRAGKWDSLEKLEIRQKIWPPMFRLRGQTLGIIGLGRIARALIPKARAFGLRVIVYSAHASPQEAQELGVELVSLERLLQEADFVSLHAALTPETRHLLGREEFRRMKPTAYLINTARGGLVDESALYTALSEGRIAGAALDVMDPEPPSPDNPLLKLDNVLITAHSAHYSDQSAVELRRKVDENVLAVLRGEFPPGLLNPQAKERYRARWGSVS